MSPDDETGQVPENLPGLTDSRALARYERRMAALRVDELEHDPSIAAGDFDLAHLQRIHAHILRDVYAWAGRIRTTDTQAMGMAHCRPEFLPGELDRVFTAIDRHRPSATDRDAAIATVAGHWGELTAIHPFADGNSRSQRVFFHRYLTDAGWDIDWRAINAAAVHAARHVAMATVDSSFLAAQLVPGVVRAGEAAPGSLTATEGTRDPRTAAALFAAMITHKRGGGTGESFRAETAAAAPTRGTGKTGWRTVRGGELRRGGWTQRPRDDPRGRSR